MRHWLIAITFCLIASFSTGVLAQTTGAVYIGSDSLRIVSSGSSTYSCALLANNWQSGNLDRKNSSFFLSYKVQIANLKKSIKRATGSKRTKLNAKLLVLKAKSKKAQAACNAFNNGGSPTPTPSSTGNFTSNGDVSAAGKITFGIPSNLSANVTTGKNLHGMLCSGCHSDKLGRSFNSLRNSISGSPMFFTSSDVTDSELANITAYLNRFRP